LTPLGLNGKAIGKKSDSFKRRAATITVSFDFVKHRYDMQMSFGRYRFTNVSDVPIEYLRWLYSQGQLRGPLLSAIRERLEQERTIPIGAGMLLSELRALVEKYTPKKPA